MRHSITVGTVASLIQALLLLDTNPAFLPQSAFDQVRAAQIV